MKLTAKALSMHDLMAGRRTIHSFKVDELPPKEVLMRALALATRAPNHKLTEPWRFYVLGEQTKMVIVDLNASIVADKKGDKAGQLKRKRWASVPGWLVVSCAVSDDELRQREDYAACCCAIQNLSLALHSEGVGVKWTTGVVTRDVRFYAALGINPAVEQVVGLFWYGYPKLACDMMPPTPRKSLEHVLLELP